MPVAAAAILQRIADFLSVGAAPQASTEAGDGFSVLLARNAAAPAAKQADDTGKILPLDRQDLAAGTTDLPATDLEVTSESAPAAEATSATTASDDVLPSTVAMLVAAEPLPKAVPAIATPETQGAAAQDDSIAPKAQAPVTETATLAVKIAMTHVADRTHSSDDAPVDADVAVAAHPAIAMPVPAKAPKQASAVHAHTHAHGQASAKTETTVTSAPVTAETAAPITTPQVSALPQTDAAQSTDIAQTEPMPAASPVIATPTAAIELLTPTVVVAASADAAEVAKPAETALLSQQPETRPQAAHRDHQNSRSLKTERPPVDGQTKTQISDAAPADVAPMTERLTVISPISTVAPASPVAVASQPVMDAAQPTPAPLAILDQLAPKLTQTIATKRDASETRVTTPQSVRVETAAVATAQANPGRPAASPATAVTTPAQPIAAIETGTTPAPATAGVNFVARAARPSVGRTPAPQPVEAPAPAAKAETAAPVAANMVTTAEALPFRATARQILAAQPASTDAPRVIESETTMRAPAADAAPTIAQQLAPVSHGSERIISTALPTATTALSTEQAAALVETIQMLRSEAKSDAMTLAVDHDELGKITMRFDRTDHGVAVRIDSPDPAVNQLIANSAPALRASGDGVGMRFERQDTAGSGTGSSRDAPRQGAGQDRHPTPYAQSSRPRANGPRDGLFA